MKAETSHFEPTSEFAAKMDAADPLSHYRKRFHFPLTSSGAEAIYFTGNSLGLMPKTARGYVEQELKDWETLAVEAHFKAKNPWMPYHEFLTKPMANVIGAKASETVVMNALTVNLHLLLVSFYRPTLARKKIVIEKGAFPSDHYALESQIRFHGLDPKECLVELAPREGESTLRTSDIIDHIDREKGSIALILFGGVNYFTGQAFEMREITEAGHRAGAIVGL